MAGPPVNLFRVVAYDSTNPNQPPELMGMPDQFLPTIGRIVMHWAMMEQEAELLILALLSLSNTSEPGWQKRPFSKRWALLLAEFNNFASGEAGLLKEMREVDRLAKSAKPVRDGLAHQRILMGMDDGGNFLRFEIENKAYPWSRAYYEAELKTSSMAISNAAGRLFRLMNPDHPTSATLPGRSLLQRLPNMDHRRFPMPPKRQPPPQS